MKQHWRREVFWLGVPVLLLAGAVFWRTQSKNQAPLFSLSKWLDKGPLRLEITSRDRLVAPARWVADGYDVGVRLRYQPGGISPFPSSFSRQSIAVSSPGKLRLAYRIGRRWRAVGLQNKNPIFGPGESVVWVDLDKVPPTAQEVRLRGFLRESQDFRGSWPPGKPLPAGVKRWPSGDFSLDVVSKPFDILLKGEDESWPKPQVSRATGVRFLRSQYTYDLAEKSLRLTFQNLHPESKTEGLLSLLDWEARDAQERKVALCRGNSPFYGFSVGAKASENQAPHHLTIHLGQIPKICAPKKYRAPFKLRLRFSFKEQWPFWVEVPFESR